MTVDHDRLINLLNRLKLTNIRNKLDNLLDEAARKQLNLREAFLFLCEQEVSDKNQSRLRTGVVRAKFPYIRT